jgi:hypothetical protein
VGPFQINSNNIPVALDGHSSVVYNGYLYITGGHRDYNFFNTVYYAKINSDGSVGAFQTNINNIPVPLSEHFTVVHNGYIYITGGATTNSSFNTVYYAKINSDGSVGSFQANSNNTPISLNKHSSEVYNGYLYITGGYGNSGSQNKVYYAKINSDGSVGVFKTNTNDIPVSLYEHSTVVCKDFLYITGGYYSASIGRNTVYYAKINSGLKSEYSSIGLNFSQAPSLTWTGEQNYVNDGLNPETGTSTTTFVFKVKYIDYNNDVPKQGYPKLHLLKNGVEYSTSPYTMNYGSRTYNSGAIYEYKIQLSSTGVDYAYYFETYDIDNSSGSDSMTGLLPGPQILPILTGRVTENDGITPIEEPKIMILSNEIIQSTVTTDMNGYYAIMIATGIYDMISYAYSYACSSQTNVVVNNEPLVTINFSLEKPKICCSTNTVITFPDLQVELPVNTLSNDTDIRLRKVNFTELDQYPVPYSSVLKPIGLARKIEFGNGQKVLNGNMKITMNYGNNNEAFNKIQLDSRYGRVGMTDLASVEANLRLFWWDEDKKVWQYISNSALDTVNKTVAGYHNKSGIYRLMEYNTAAIEQAGSIYEVSNYPNPFEASKGKKTKIRYYLKEDTEVEIKIYNLLGEVIWEKKISKGETPGGKSGPNEVEWNGTDKSGVIVDMGAYICCIKTGETKQITKIGVK